MRNEYSINIELAYAGFRSIDPFPLTPTLSLGEGVSQSVLVAIGRAGDYSSVVEWFSLSLGRG
jgi:hypothetical protein